MKADGDRQMECSILTPIAAIHATVLSIVAAVTIAFYFYAENRIHAFSANLNDARHEVAQTTTAPSLLRVPKLDYGDYMNGDSVDLPKIHREILELCGLIQRTPPQEEVSAPDNGEQLLDLLSFLSQTYPYSERLHRDGQGWATGAPERKSYDPKWRKNLVAMNQVLLINKKSILTQVVEFEQRDRQEHAEDYSARAARERNELGFFTGPTQMVTDFYNRIEFIQNNTVPRIEDNAFKLTSYQERFKMKSRLILTLVIAIIVFFSGILVPLLLHLIGVSNVGVQFVLLIVTLLPYLCLLVFLLTAVAKWQVP